MVELLLYLKYIQMQFFMRKNITLFLKTTITTVNILLAFVGSQAQSPVSSGLIAKYCFDGDGKDAIGVKNCTVYGATPSTDRLSRPNRAYYFDGVDDYIQLPNDVWVYNDLTICGWIKVDSYKNFARFFEFGNGTVAGNNVVYSPTPTGAPSIDAYHVHTDSCGGAIGTFTYAHGPSFPLGVWTFVAIVQRGSSAEVWRNGLNVTITSMVVPPPCNIVRKQNYFGRSNWSGDAYFHGSMDNVRIYNRALTPSEIDTLYKLDDLCTQTSITESVADRTNRYLSQNFPNPTDGNTEIEYTLPSGNQHASIGIFDITGRKIKSFNLKSNSGVGNIIIQKGELIPGLYFYSLISDGKTLDTKKMMITGN